MKKDLKIIYNFFRNLLNTINKFNYDYPILFVENNNFAAISYTVKYSDSNESEQSYRNIMDCLYSTIINTFGDKAFISNWSGYSITTRGVYDYHILPDFRINNHCVVQRSINTCTTFINFYGLNSEYIEIIKSIFGKNIYHENNIRKNN